MKAYMSNPQRLLLEIIFPAKAKYAAIDEVKRILAETEPTHFQTGLDERLGHCECPEHITRYCPNEALAEALAAFVAD